MANSVVNFLLIEDDDVDILSIQREFKKLKLNINIIVAKDALYALDLLRGTNNQPKLIPYPNLILLDINIPKMNGIEFLKVLREDNELKDLKVFILTTAFTQRDKIATQNLHVEDYIVKPLQASDIMNLYWSVLGSSA